MVLLKKNYNNNDNNAIKPDMLIIDKEGKKISLIEGTICAPGCIAKREKEKQDKYSEMRKSLVVVVVRGVQTCFSRAVKTSEKNGEIFEI